VYNNDIIADENEVSMLLPSTVIAIGAVTTFGVIWLSYIGDLSTAWFSRRNGAAWNLSIVDPAELGICQTKKLKRWQLLARARRQTSILKQSCRAHGDASLRDATRKANISVVSFIGAMLVAWGSVQQVYRDVAAEGAEPQHSADAAIVSVVTVGLFLLYIVIAGVFLLRDRRLLRPTSADEESLSRELRGQLVTETLADRGVVHGSVHPVIVAIVIAAILIRRGA